MQPYEELSLIPAPEGYIPLSDQRNTIEKTDDRALLSNGKLSLEVPLGKHPISASAHVPGPIYRMQRCGGLWRGCTYLDTRNAPTGCEGTIREHGPLRTVYEYRAEWADGGSYEAVITLDSGQVFARIEETFDTEPGAQLVWDFAGSDLPAEAWVLNSAEGCTSVPLHNRFDRRLARLASWNQYSQLHDLSDGYALGFEQGDDTIGFVSINGGAWHGNRQNHAELWIRRWERNDPRTRKDTPWDVKADWTDHPERILARGDSISIPHVNVESWIVSGHRRSALVIADRAFVQSGGLRRLHTRRGVVTLEEITRMELSASTASELGKRMEAAPFKYPNHVLESHFLNRFSGSCGEDRITHMLDYTLDMTQGFWNGAGASHVNCVIGRMIAPCMFLLEHTVEEGSWSSEDRERCSSRLLFLAYLFASDHYYPGLSTMRPIGDMDTVEPTMTGMSNQNFYTDIINVFATAAQIFPEHPMASAWKEKFVDMWQLQMQFHMYPDSGLWEESHTYYNHVLYTLLPLLLRRRDDGAEDEFANPTFHKLLGSSIRQFTPRYAENDNARNMVAFGDHFPETTLYRTQYGEYAMAIKPHDSELAGRLAWAYREMNGTRELCVLEQAFPWIDEYVQGLGYMFRSQDDNDQECLLALRSGSAWGHHHNDEGSIHFYAKGHALILDSAFSKVQKDPEKKLGHRGQSRWTLRDIEPMNYFFRFNRGWIAAHDQSAVFPYATAYDPIHMFFMPANRLAYPMRRPLEHERTIIRLAPTSFIVVDKCVSDMPQVVRFHVAGDHGIGSDESVVNAVIGQCRLSIVPLTSERLMVETERDADMASGQYCTTEFAFHCGLRPMNAFYISADEIQSSAPRVMLGDKDDDKVYVTHGDRSWQLKFNEDGTLTITDDCRGVSQTL
ncbi:hypothetical protein [Cohnella sp. WQ 127256]|uniref:hypothetical protein n=1 Tax=Cohnella sp. WQ 127256 TaxID=2938790 RepID=UPI002119B426|nr:hypothetical protein [Cohnella sp. WQ 127256]